MRSPHISLWKMSFLIDKNAQKRYIWGSYYYKQTKELRENLCLNYQKNKLKG